MIYMGGAFMVGIVSGLYYFYGLLLTVRRVATSSNPRKLLAVSYVVRLVPVLLVLVLLARKDPGAFIACLAGFFVVRAVMTRKVGLIKEGDHAAQP